MKIGIFGGCFNPPHLMHKNIPIYLIEMRYIDKVIYVPTESSYNKKGLIRFKDRYNMLNLMIDDNPNLEVSDIADKGYKYTYQVLDYFNNDDNDIYFICGSDNLKEFKTWKNSEYILNNYKLLVIKRNNDNIDEITKKYNKNNIIISKINENYLSSTIIRDKIKNKEYIKSELDSKVYKYVIKNNLYK